MMELTTVIVITMIASTIAVASYRIYQRDLPVKYAAERLTRAMTTARSYAVASNGYYTVQIDQRYQNYWIDETDESGAVIVPKVTAPENLGELPRFAGFTLGGNTVTSAGMVIPVRFAPDGSCNDARITIQMGSAPAPISYDVRVYGPTGISRVIANVATPAGQGKPAGNEAPARTAAPGRLAVNQ